MAEVPARSHWLEESSKAGVNRARRPVTARFLAVARTGMKDFVIKKTKTDRSQAEVGAVPVTTVFKTHECADNSRKKRVQHP